MDQNKVLELCERLVGLNKDPHPGLFTWNEACVRTINELRAELAMAAPQSEPTNGKLKTAAECRASVVDAVGWAARVAGNSHGNMTVEEGDAIGKFVVDRLDGYLNARWRESQGPYR